MYALCAIDVEFAIKHAPTRYYQASALNKLHNSVNCTTAQLEYLFTLIATTFLTRWVRTYRLTTTNR